MTAAGQPLAGLRVLDLSRILAGPVCCQILADLGADVVKVERPHVGDDTRQWGPPFVAPHGPSAYYLSANRGKRSLALDLSSPRATEVLVDLVRRADVLVENFRPHTARRLGLEPARLAKINPRLVSCSISGYGRTGPWADVPGYDLVVQATAGLMSITGPVEGPPMKVGVAITDVITGLYAAVSVLAGLQGRDRGATAQAADLALADCTLASLVNVAQSALVTGQRPRRWGNAHPNIVPYEAFATADGHLVLAVGNDAQWQRFCQAAGAPDLAAESRYATNPSRVEHREELVSHVAGLLLTRSTAAWHEALSTHGVPHAPVMPLDEVLDSEQVAAREMIVETVDRHGRPLPLIGSPIHWHAAPRTVAPAPPELGEHTDQVLDEWLGYGAERVAELRAAGVVA